MKKAIIMIAAALALAGLSAMAFASGEEQGSAGDPLVTKGYVDQAVSEAAGAWAFAPIEIKAGHTLTGGVGAEIILRSGEATAIGNESNGVSDLTAGVDLATGEAVQTNHLLLVPRDDGRGLKALTDGWVMVRGSHAIE